MSILPDHRGSKTGGMTNAASEERRDATHMLVDFDAIAERICPEAATLQFFKQHGADLRALIAKAAGR